ncbi:MAG: hypothetical protein Q9208_004660 [Pyrenodesmia sp. 3 TL-2023]
MAPSNSRLPVWQLTVDELRDQLRRERDRTEASKKLARTRVTTVNRQRKSLAEKDKQLSQMNEQLAHTKEKFWQANAEIKELHVKLATIQREIDSIHTGMNPTLSNHRRSSSIGAGIEALNIHSPSGCSDDESAPLLSPFGIPSSESFDERQPLLIYRAPAAPMYPPNLGGSAATQDQMPFRGQSYEQAHVGVPLQAKRIRTSRGMSRWAEERSE